jgi:alkylhydroperoxidase family enzyme
MKKKMGLNIMNTIGSINDALLPIKQDAELLTFAESVINPDGEDSRFSIGFTSRHLLEVLEEIEARNFWDKVHLVFI